MMQDLDLTDAQKEQVKSITDSFHKKQQQAHEEMLGELKKVLKPDQYEKLERRMKPPQHDGPGPRDRPGPPDRPGRSAAP